MTLNSFELAGLSFLEVLARIVAGLASANNPAYGAIIGVATDAIGREVEHVKAGGKPTPHDPAAATLAAATVAAAATAVARNNPKVAPVVSQVAVAAETAIASSVATPPPADAPLAPVVPITDPAPVAAEPAPEVENPLAPGL